MNVNKVMSGGAISLRRFVRVLIRIALAMSLLLSAQAQAVESSASGNYTWDPNSAVLTINWGSSTFSCEGPPEGSTDIVTGVTITSTTVTNDDGDVWTRTDGTAGDVVGTWAFPVDDFGNLGTLTFDTNNTVSVVANVVRCHDSKAQVVNNSGDRIDHVDIGNITLSENLSDCGNGCSTGFPGVAEGTNEIAVYQLATSTPVSVGALGPFMADHSYAVNIRYISGRYCAELWQRPEPSTVFNEDTTKLLIGTTCSGSRAIYADTPLPPPTTVQTVYAVPTGQIPEGAVSVDTRGSVFGDATLVVTLDLSRVLTGGFLSVQGQFAAAYNIYVGALVPRGALGRPSATWFVYRFVDTDKYDWAEMGTPIAAYMEGIAEDATNSVEIKLLQGMDVTGLVGSEIYIGYGISDAEMLEAKRYRGVFIVQ